MSPTKMSWQFSANVPTMASIQVMSAPEDIEAVDQIAVTVEPGSAPQAIGLQPSGSSPIKLLVVRASRYKEDLKFAFSDDDVGTNTSQEIILKAPQVFTESTMAAIFSAPRFLQVTNPTGEQPLELFIYLVRDATP